MSKIIDISPEIRADIAVWPGDTPYSRTINLDYKNGDNLVLSEIKGTLHLGAHTDAPNHYDPNGVGMSERALDYYYGYCQVVSVEIERGKRIYPEDIHIDSISSERILFCTNSYPDPYEFNEDFNSLSPEVIHVLASKGVKLVGIDTPSVDPFDSKVLESHNAIGKNNMAILEGVLLKDVKPGIYTLAAIPLKLQNADASPVRAILIER